MAAIRELDVAGAYAHITKENDGQIIHARFSGDRTLTARLSLETGAFERDEAPTDLTPDDQNILTLFEREVQPVLRVEAGEVFSEFNDEERSFHYRPPMNAGALDDDRHLNEGDLFFYNNRLMKVLGMSLPAGAGLTAIYGRNTYAYGVENPVVIVFYECISPPLVKPARA